MKKTQSLELLSKATEALKEATGLSVRTLDFEPTKEDRGYDSHLTIGFTGQRIDYFAQVKSYVSNEILGGIISNLKRLHPRSLLVTRQLTSNQADRLRKLNIPFFDTAGNAFFNDPPLYVFVSGRRSTEEEPRQKASRIFAASGLKTLFVLLSNPGLELEPYRNIAAAADVSHGTVGWVMSDLEAQGYLVDMGNRGRTLKNRADLVRQWVDAYPRRLRPKLILGRYTSNDPNWWHEANLEGTDAYWSGEVAAAKITGYLRPEIKTIYATSRLPQLQARFALKQSPNGDTEILKKFWKGYTEDAKPDVAPPLLVYADLIASGDDRNIETAEIIYDTQISRLIQQT